MFSEKFWNGENGGRETDGFSLAWPGFVRACNWEVRLPAATGCRPPVFRVSGGGGGEREVKRFTCGEVGDLRKNGGKCYDKDTG